MAHKIIGRIINHTCMIFTATAVFISAFSAALQISSLALSFGSLMRILLLSVFISLADLIFLTDRLGLAAKIFIHYAAFLISFLAIFLLAGNSGRVNGVIYVAVLLSLIYFIVAGICAAVHASRKRKKRDESKYKKQFGGV